jgi:hypothetical protein
MTWPGATGNARLLLGLAVQVFGTPAMVGTSLAELE